MSPAAPVIFRHTIWNRALHVLGTCERIARALSARQRRGASPARRQLGRELTQRFNLPGLPAGRSSARLDRSARLPRLHDGAIAYLPSLPWRFRFQRPQQLARGLAQHGQQVVYIEGFLRTRLQPSRWLHQVSDGVFQLQVRISGRPDLFRQSLPPAEAEYLAALVARGMVRPPAAVVVQLPGWTELAIALSRRYGCPLVYDRMDLHTGFPGVPNEIAAIERRLLEAADLVTTSSQDLLSLSSAHNSSSYLLANAVALDDFPLAAPPRNLNPRIGYVGALSQWFDEGAVARAAEEHPEWRFELAGHVENDAVHELRRMPNVRLLGEMSYSSVPTFLARLDVALIPFRDQPLTRAVDPVKLYEAYATGLPVVARQLPSLGRWGEPHLFTYHRSPELSAAIDRALVHDHAEHRRRRRALVETETWYARAARLLDLLHLDGTSVPLR